MSITDLARPAFGRSIALARRLSGFCRSCSLLSAGFAIVALSGASAAQAQGLTYDWVGTGTGTGPTSAWGNELNWVSVPGGQTGTPTYEDENDVTIRQGNVNVGQKGWGAANMDVSGGTLHLFAGKDLLVTEWLTVRDAGVVEVDGTFSAGYLLMQDGGLIDIMAPIDGKSAWLNVAEKIDMQGGTIEVGG